MKRVPGILLAAVGVLVALGILRASVRPRDLGRGPSEPGAAATEVPSRTSPVPRDKGSENDVRVVAEGLEIPWALAVAPDGAFYATERPGRLVRIRDGKTETIATLPDVSQRSESGLLGLALDPRFSQSGLLYLYYTTTGGANRVVRFRLTDGALTEPRVLLDRIPAAAFHDGGRIAFGPDGNLYITTGDAAQPELAQRPDSLAGKILRIRPDGTIPADNPFPSSPVYSFGHRNPQGLAWAADGTLYSTEHGPSGPGAQCCHDEVNRIEPGKNYGWSETGRSGKLGVPGLVDPLIESGPTETWAPSSAAVIGDTLYFGGLRGQALYALDFKNPSSPRVFFKGEFGRIRDVVRGPDGKLYLTTSNRDGRGGPKPGDDRIIRFDPRTL